MSTDPQTLFNEVSCMACYASSAGQMQLLKLALLQQILLAQNPMADTSPQTLLEQAKCYSCNAPTPGMMKLLELALLAQIAQNGASGGSGVTCGAYGGGAPNFTPTTPCAIAIDTDTGTQWQYFNGAWH